jgi:putative aminopeptidase FrvX
VNRVHLGLFGLVFSVFCFLLPARAMAQSLRDDLAAFVETPAVTGYESISGGLAAKISARLKPYSAQTDNMGNVFVILGSGAPHRLIVAPMDEPGYIVSGITEDGYLRVQRLPQQASHALFDQLHAAQPVVIHTRRGDWVRGVVAGLSTHLQSGRRSEGAGLRVAHPDEMYVDIGARTAAEVHEAGVDLLDPIALDRKLYEMGFGKLTGVSIGDRFGVSAVVELLRRIDPAKLRGTLTLGFVAQQWASSRGLDRLLQHVQADEMLYVGRLLPERPEVSGELPARHLPSASLPSASLPSAGRGGLGTSRAVGASHTPQREPGSGVLLGTREPAAPLGGLAEEIKRLAEENRIGVAADFSAALPRGRYTQGPVLPQRFAYLGIATAWASTPAEVIDFTDLRHLVTLLETYACGTTDSARQEDLSGGKHLSESSLRERPSNGAKAPLVTEILQKLVESYGVSGHEGPVQQTIARLLPPWARPEADEAGNLILRLGSAPRSSKRPGILFVAHSDEIGYEVVSIGADGRLRVETRGGSLLDFFAGHTVFVHASTGIRAGIMELPSGWDQPNFEWPRGPRTLLRVDVGARTLAQAEQLGIKVGDSVTVPKNYRPLFGTRANGRSFDDRVGCTALVRAAWEIGPSLEDREVIFLWSTKEEVGLRGALGVAQRLAGEGRSPNYVFAVDTFVSSDSPLESKRFAYAVLGKGFVIRAVDNSNLVRRELVDRLISLAGVNHIPVQYGVTGGGNDGAAFLRYGTTDIPISWPLRYSHSPGEVIDTRDVEALAQIVAAIARRW